VHENGTARLVLPDGFPREIEAIATDLDRTLIGEDALLRPRTIAAIHAARAAGIHVVVVTGRMFRAVLPYVQAAGIDDPVVCYQGAVVAEPGSGRFLRHVPIPLELAREAIAALDGWPINCYVDDELYVAEHTEASRSYAEFQDLDVHEVGPLLDWLDAPPTKLVVVDEPERLDRLEVEMKERFGARMFIAKSLPYFLEFANADVSKGSGLAFLAEHLGFARARTIGIGDGENDRELLDWAAYAVAVENAHDSLKERADLLIPGPDEEGVAQLIEACLARS
jgi:Cof subfamily protein (haloacid dehalogenase superfamily)